MKINEKYLNTIYVAFGRRARDDILLCLEKIVATLESMPEEESNAILNVLAPEVRKAIIDE